MRRFIRSCAVNRIVVKMGQSSYLFCRFVSIFYCTCRDNIPRHGPVLFTVNHANQFMDAVSVLCKYGPICFFRRKHIDRIRCSSDRHASPPCILPPSNRHVSTQDQLSHGGSFLETTFDWSPGMGLGKGLYTGVKNVIALVTYVCLTCACLLFDHFLAVGCGAGQTCSR